MRLKAHQEQFIRAAFDAIGEVVSRQEILNLCEDEGLEYPHWLTSNPKYRHSLRAHYVLPMDRLDDAPATKTKTKKTKTAVVNADPGPGSASVVASPAAPAPVSSSPATDTTMEFNGGKSLVPDKMKAYVAWGHHDFIGKIVDSGRFYPVYITGLSGNGKTTSVEQVCAEKNREFFRVNINVETDEDDLLGGFRLIDGNTVFQYGPVAEAMRRGAVLLLDEVDLGTTKIMCLQSVLEGKGVYLKKINRWVHPAEGFQVFLTGNTKGQGNGDHDDKFVGTNVLNEAFLDRIPVMLDQDYPPAIIEKKILGKVVKESCGSVDSDAKGFIDNLAKWAEIVRHTFAEGAIEDVITTRRLVQIVQGYCILGDRVESIKNCLTRFDASVQDSFLSLYDKIDADVNTSPTASASDSADSVSTATVPDDAVMALTVSFAERNSVKTHGAEWNPIEKRWFFQRSVWNNLSAETRATITANFAPTWADLDTQTRKITEIKAYVAQPNPVTV